MSLYMNQKVSDGSSGWAIEVIRSRRRTLALELKEDGRVLLRVPRWCSGLEIRRFVEQNRDWIERKLRENEERREALAAIPKLTEEELRALQKRGRAVFPARCAVYASLLGVSYGRISVRRQHSKWGSCSGKGNLNFNCLLLLAPESVLDYVVVHELCHRREMNHSKRFWALVESICPDFREARRWLRENGGALLARLP